MITDNLYHTLLGLLEPYYAPPAWQFDLASALIGVAATLLLFCLIYILRGVLHQIWEALLSSLRRLLHYLLAGTEEVYRDRVVAWALSSVTPPVVPLDAVFIEPEFLVPSPIPQSLSEVEPRYAYSTTPLHQVLEGHPRLMIVGASGMGKTTLLAYLALACARAEESELLPQAVQKRLPLYVTLPALDWDGAEQEGRKRPDALAILTNAAISAIGAGRGLTPPLRKSLETGQAIVLADGWDELSPSQRQHATAWLTELADALPGNLWLVSAGPQGYGPLIEAGFVPLTLAYWGLKEVEAFAQKWLTAYVTEGEAPPAVLRELSSDLSRDARMGRTSLDLALRAFVYLTDHQVPAGRAALFDRALDLLLRQWPKQTQEEDAVLLTACRAALGQVALMLRQEGRMAATGAEIEAAIETALPPPGERPARAAARVFALISQSGLLRRVDPDRYAFAHSLWQAYVVARQLVAAPATLTERLEDPHWADVLGFYAELGDMSPLVALWLRTPDDLFHTRLRTLSGWIGAAPAGAAWRNGAMAMLARTFLQPAGHFMLVRRTLAEALATSGATGVKYFLKQALQHPDADVRIAAIHGLARVANDLDLPAFEAAMRDEQPAVREEAVRVTALLGSDAARRQLEQMLLEGDDALRLVVAEALVRCGAEGAKFLREMVESEDVVIRRAAVLGLGLAGARDVLEKVARDDEQWIVRSAALSALEELEKRRETRNALSPPQVEQLPWLISWAATRGEGVGLGEAARLMLRRALREGDNRVRLAAAQALGDVGRSDDAEALLAALTDPDRNVAEAAIEALAEISRRYELKIEVPKGPS